MCVDWVCSTECYCGDTRSDAMIDEVYIELTGCEAHVEACVETRGDACAGSRLAVGRQMS